MRIAVGADEQLDVAQYLLDYLRELGHDVDWFGPSVGESQPWPQVAEQVAGSVASGEAQMGIALCWTGTGVCIAANKVRGIRAALCVDAETARGARLWNDANVLCLSMRLTSRPVAKEIVDAWLVTDYLSNPTDDACLALIRKLEE